MKLSVKLLAKVLGKRKLLRQIVAFLLAVIRGFYSRLYDSIVEGVEIAQSHPEWSGEEKRRAAWDHVREKIDDADDWRWVTNLAIEILVGQLLRVGASPRPRFEILLEPKGD